MAAADPNSIVVFLGPSCDLSLAREALKADYRPPARRGDMASAASSARIIVLIDGCLIHYYPPSPTEIWEVIESGVIVYGAASLGAMRGVELRRHGMRATGWVFERYLDGSIDCDDEVVVLFNEQTGTPTTVPLVRVRYALECLGRQGLVNDAQSSQLLQRLRAIYLEGRTTMAVRDAAIASGIPADITERIFSDIYDIKAIDTLACLRDVASESSTLSVTSAHQ
jgi:hypothetical protein